MAPAVIAPEAAAHAMTGRVEIFRRFMIFSLGEEDR
jgi:hypothetical protein